MQLALNFLSWLRGGLGRDRVLFWLGCLLYGCFALMLQQRNFQPVDAATAAVLTLSCLAFCEAAIGFVRWSAGRASESEVKTWSRLAIWIRPLVYVHIVLAWWLLVAFHSAPPLGAIVIGLGVCVFGLAKTLPGLNIEGRVANWLLAAVIVIPCLAVVTLGGALGL